MICIVMQEDQDALVAIDFELEESNTNDQHSKHGDVIRNLESSSAEASIKKNQILAEELSQVSSVRIGLFIQTGFMLYFCNVLMFWTNEM